MILNWNGMNHTRECLKSIQKISYQNYSVLVIDNASTDGSMTVFRNEFPNIDYLELDSNYGFAGGMNRGLDFLRKNPPDFVGFLNNDIVVAPDFLDHLVNAFNENGKDNIYGPKILYFHKKDKIWFAGGKIDFTFARVTHRGIRQQDCDLYSENIETDYITGCCLFSSWSTANELTGFNEKFNMYGEDVDYCIRAANLGSKCFMISSAKIWHKVSSSIGGHWSWRKNWKKFNSLVKLLDSHGTIVQKITGFPLLILYSIFMFPYLIVKQFTEKN